MSHALRQGRADPRRHRFSFATFTSPCRQIIMAFSASISWHSSTANIQIPFIDKSQNISPKSLKHLIALAFLPPFLRQVPHFDNTGSHAKIDNRVSEAISQEYELPTYFVSATSFKGIHKPFCNPSVGIVKFLFLRFPFVVWFPNACSNLGGISFDKTLGGAKPPFTMTHCTL